ncbi:PDZ domain-containing protein, partial [Candidatus Desantisbacteria bacterium]|nr:PDZ domain-containing protein [Candidatus Desantisbacteria bacterium]
NIEMVMPQLFWPFNSFVLEGENVGSIVRWIGHDAPIYGGNSGGPLVNMQGEIIGINEIGMGLSGAIPGNLAKKVADELIKNREVVRSSIGLEVQPLFKSSSYKKGVFISDVTEGSPAELAGFLSGDILLKIGDKEVSVNFAEELPLFNQFIMDLPLSKKINALILRNDKEINLEITPIKREQVIPPVREIRLWGMTASNLSLIMAQEMKRKTKEGVFVNNVRPGGPCNEAKPEIRSKDIILELNGSPINSLEELMDFTEKISGDSQAPVSVLVGFERNMEKYLTVIKLGDKKLEDKGGEVKKAWLGVGFQVLTRDLAEALGIKGTTGVRLTNIYPGSPGEKYGLKTGDLIIELDGDTITSSEPHDIDFFPALVRQYKTGATVEFTVLRSDSKPPYGEKIKIKIELGSSPPSEKEMKRYRDKDFEFTVRNVTFMDTIKTDKELMNDKKIIVEAVDEGGWASLGHMAVGDFILRINDIPIPDVDFADKIMKELKSQKVTHVVFQVQRGIHKIFIEIQTKYTN